MLHGYREQLRPGGIRGWNHLLRRANSSDSRQQMSFSVDKSESPKYDGDLKFDRWEIPAGRLDSGMSSTTSDTLTRWEWRGLAAEHNLADGHARHFPSPEEATVVRALPEVFAEAARTDQATLQQRFANTFFSVNNQRTALKLSPPVFHYSSSISIEVVANYLRLEGQRCLLLEPTFDNIPAIFRRHGIPIMGFDEALLESPNQLNLKRSDALFVVLSLPLMSSAQDSVGFEPTSWCGA